MIMSGHRLGLFVLAVTMLFAAGASAQQKHVWLRTCVDNKKPTTCRIGQQLFLSKKIDGKQKNLGLVLGLSILYSEDPKTKKRALYMTFRMPLGVDLRPGAVMRIDKGPEIRLTYLQCTNSGCDASLPLDGKILKALKSGNTINIGFRPWGQTKVTAIPASLKGFTKAFRGLK
mgnify:CR=1 FL=1